MKNAKIYTIYWPEKELMSSADYSFVRRFFADHLGEQEKERAEIGFGSTRKIPQNLAEENNG